MNRISLVQAAAAGILLASAIPALGMNCYAVIDRNDRIVYQGLQSPVDLSDAGTAARDALRAKGEQLVAMNTRDCPEVDTLNFGADHRPATVAEIVAAMRPALRYGVPARGGSVDGSTGGTDLPRITPPVATGGGTSTYNLPSGTSLR